MKFSEITKPGLYRQHVGRRWYTIEVAFPFGAPLWRATGCDLNGPWHGADEGTEGEWHGPLRNGWVPAECGRPEECERVLMLSGEFIQTGDWNKAGWGDDANRPVDGVTHWQPLPLLP